MLLQAGVNASSEQVLEWLVKADTASAFNISFGDVSVTGVQQVCQLSCLTCVNSHRGDATSACGFWKLKAKLHLQRFGAARLSSLKLLVDMDCL